MLRLALLLSLLGIPAWGQIRIDFYAHPEATIGPYMLYVVQFCNASSAAIKGVQGGSAWHEAKVQGLFTPQLTSEVLKARDLGTKTSTKAWFLRGSAWGAAVAGALTGTKTLGNLSLETGLGKLAVATAPVVALVLESAARAIQDVPEKDVDVHIDRILPGTLDVGALSCSQDYVLWGIPITR